MTFSMHPSRARIIAEDLRGETAGLNSDLDAFLASAQNFLIASKGDYVVLFNDVYKAWHTVTEQMAVTLNVGAIKLDEIVDRIVAGDNSMASTISSAGR